MYGHKEEAEKCFEIAENALTEGNVERAIKFLEKAERLHSTTKAKGNNKIQLLIKKELWDNVFVRYLLGHFVKFYL